MIYDVIIIGGGPAGISAAIYSVSRGLKTILLEKSGVGGVIGTVSSVTHYSGIIEEETGETFSKRMEKQAIDSGVNILKEEVLSVYLEDPVKKIQTTNGIYETKTIIIAAGSTPRRLNIPGENALLGKGVCISTTKDAMKFSNRNIYVVGGSDGAIKEALYLSKFAKKLTIIHFEEKLSAINEFLNKVNNNDKIELKLNSRIIEIQGTDSIEGFNIQNQNTGHIETVKDKNCGIFIYAGSTPNTNLFHQLKYENDYIKTNDKMETNIPGVYAAGDIRVKQVRQVATAVSDGSIAAINCELYIKSLSN
ncbi:MAG: NAD(P)/FAD-dependent oxidoreductase [Aminipila sp.]